MPSYRLTVSRTRALRLEPSIRARYTKSPTNLTRMPALGLKSAGPSQLVGNALRFPFRNRNSIDRVREEIPRRKPKARHSSSSVGGGAAARCKAATPRLVVNSRLSLIPHLQRCSCCLPLQAGRRRRPALVGQPAQERKVLLEPLPARQAV